MANKSIRKVAAAEGQISGLNTSRYEKAEVAFGVIEQGSYDLNDVVSFDDVRSFKVIEARITAHTPQPITLEVNPGTDLSNVLLLNITDNVKISYAIHYIRGTGKAGSGPAQGDLLRVALGDV